MAVIAATSRVERQRNIALQSRRIAMLKQRLRVRVFLLLLAPALACALVAAATLLLRPRSFGSHQETIGYVLEQHGVRYRSIALNQNWPEAVNYYAYGHQVYPFNVNVTVVLADGNEVPGRLECLDDRRRCTLYVPRLGIDKLRLPDVSARRAWPWEAWLLAIWEKVKS
jgi:hypothetical protein